VAVDIELADLQRGRTVVDWFPDRLRDRGRAAAVDVAVGVDSVRFADLLVDVIGKFD
jgi:inosine-uridine nucleoside N-ribohydrolase